MRGADYIVRTRSFGRLSAEIARLSGGAVGLAGPRGAGKSSLLDQYRAGRIAEAGTAGRQLVVTESVPVRYEPREYVLYLYGRLCQEVVAFIPPPSLSRGRSHRTRFGVSATVAITAGAAWLAVVLLGAAKLPGSISRIPVVIVFDELDKMSDPERVQDFLNTVKSLFSLEIAGCLFLVSVSEDALARFERRGLPIRDAMDSTFDAVVPVEYLNLDDATALISDRVAGLPDPFIALLHSLGGGLPRELLRYTRSLVRHRDEKHLGAIARSLVGEDLRMKARGLGAVIARRGLAEPYASDLMKFVNDNTEPDPVVLLKAVAAPPLPAEQADDLADALHLQMETLGYLYFCATVLEAFTGVRKNDYTDRRGSFDTLASARQLFAVNARLAWLTVNSFRRQWSLPEVAPPG
ncbi:hypothetical protein [Paractinoplanes brasiliensis]|uniref:AAA ATPase-like protein n=1 Tax=Paractinoplanes brasiliensis TaxID=52695 RepID=A0A4R6J9N0_9ACTN|nr:hypothetical protein [Actinoplanes brasiliensis]TDO32319.1 hypothetical protein C8E87_7776 [Actinoplanes brasiliensis]GID27814.1 hypothetical protein Abr02nite_27970 [Actinoplanes brasiliensis]